MTKLNVDDLVIHLKTKTPGKIIRNISWKHSDFELYSMQPENQNLKILYGNLEDFEIIIPTLEKASVPQLEEGVDSNST